MPGRLVMILMVVLALVFVHGKSSRAGTLAFIAPTAGPSVAAPAPVVPVAGPGTAMDPGPDWLTRFETLLAAPGQAAAALTYLDGLPLARKTTSDYHWALARAYLAAGKPKHAASALATYALLPAAPPRDVQPLIQKLCSYGTSFMKKALDCLHKKDHEQAMKNYWSAVYCDQAVLGRQDEGLADLTMGYLTRRARMPTDDPDHWFFLGFYNFHFSHMEAALSAFQTYQGREKDPYKSWHAALWIQQARIARDVEKAQDAANQVADAARKAADELRWKQEQEQRRIRHRDHDHTVPVQLPAVEQPAPQPSALPPQTFTPAQEWAIQRAIEHSERREWDREHDIPVTYHDGGHDSGRGGPH